jgi:hypothetical protein
MTWRVGSKVGRLIYRGDEVVGIMDTYALATEVVSAMNAWEARSSPASARIPAAILGLANWKLQLPLPRPDADGILEVLPSALATMTDAGVFFRASPLGDSVLFRAPTNGATTPGSEYPRSELREMKGADKAAWSTTSGGHHMEIDQAITAVPRGKPHVVAGQIHDANDDLAMIRLEGDRLFVEIDGDEVALLDEHYALGDRFRVHFWAGGGRLKVFYAEGGSDGMGYIDTMPPVLSLSRPALGCYFKAGCYTQSNADREHAAGQIAGPDNYGEVEIFGLRVWHT